MKKLLIVLITIIGILAGCSQTKDDVLEDTRDIASTMFYDEDIESNTKLDAFSLYLPRGFEILEESQNNLTLEDNDQIYILFYNPLETTKSELNYQEALNSDSYTLLESFEDDHRFGYVGVRPDGELYELEVGVGQVKITTRTKLKSLDDNTEEMMKMANSIAYTSHE